MSTFRLNPDNISWTKVDNEIVIINLETTHYYSLNNSGAFIWQLLDEKDQSEKDLIEKTANYFGQNPRKIAKDVQAVLEHLATENLILER